MIASEKRASPEQLFEDISQFISTSRALLKQGAMMELAGLDDHVKALCESVLQLSQEERLAYADRMQRMLDDLKALGEEMVRQRDLMAEEIREISSHRKASVAYRTVDVSDKDEKK